jgi:hypothetical protein
MLRLPYLLRLSLEGGLILKARATWPATARIYCHRFEEPMAGGRRHRRADASRCLPPARGAAIDLVWNRPRVRAPSSALHR